MIRFFICLNNKTGENSMGGKKKKSGGKKKNSSGSGRVRGTTLPIWEFRELVVVKSSPPSYLKLILELPKPGFYSKKIILERKRIKDQMGKLTEKMYFDYVETRFFSNLYFIINFFQILKT